MKKHSIEYEKIHEKMRSIYVIMCIDYLSDDMDINEIERIKKLIYSNK